MYTTIYDLEIQSWDGLNMISKLVSYNEYLDSLEQAMHHKA